MLTNLAIRNFILIESLQLSFGHKLTVLTGETGAGKSILMDALGFVLGAKSDASQILEGADSMSVAATFEFPRTHMAAAMLAENGMLESKGAGGTAEAIIRRTLAKDGRSKAFVNDMPAGLAFVRSVGETLVEIHGQFEGLSLLNPATHMDILDAYGGHSALRSGVGDAYRAWRARSDERARAEEEFARAKADEDYLRHNLSELEELNPKEGEEEELAARRRALMDEGKAATAMEDSYAALAKYGGDPAKFARDAKYALERMPPESLGDDARAALGLLETAHASLSDAYDRLGDALAGMGGGAAAADKVEERLFRIRELARKHRAAPDGLPDILENMRSLVANIDNSDAMLAEKKRLEDEARAAYVEAAGKLSAARGKSAVGLSEKVMAELPPLKLEKAVFEVVVEPRDEKDWGANGADSVAFMGSTNAGSRRVYIHKIASGGELARFTLAIKVVISDKDALGSMVFDEVDTGISGATAAAVGERLAKLSESIQTLVVTHSPQVASSGNHHFRVSKSYDEEKGRALTAVDHLTEARRVQEIARIISGDRITDEALRAAEKLLETAARA
ncbi:MAG: DNA repair protein RecN [Rickettsiales bacterium]|jgi:DNA repair protein RecN (Recombination protein N)|nr:DNA repair protein RecN [Rickettsiales bacterium]